MKPHVRWRRQSAEAGYELGFQVDGIFTFIRWKAFIGDANLNRSWTEKTVMERLGLA